MSNIDNHGKRGIEMPKRDIIAELKQLEVIARKWLDFGRKAHGLEDHVYEDNNGRYVRCYYSDTNSYMSVSFESMTGIEFTSTGLGMLPQHYSYVTIDNLTRLPEIIKTYSDYLDALEAAQ